MCVCVCVRVAVCVWDINVSLANDAHVCDAAFCLHFYFNPHRCLLFSRQMLKPREGQSRAGRTGLPLNTPHDLRAVKGDGSGSVGSAVPIRLENEAIKRRAGPGKQA